MIVIVTVIIVEIDIVEIDIVEIDIVEIDIPGIVTIVGIGRARPTLISPPLPSHPSIPKGSWFAP
ncbi:hypothetical protein [Marinomonas balearica]|uniref:Uncharacterized protein n=1 Tax=Marinomonas balearica TaxID=491947 RepID=A0A4R6MIA3_9GAMM|nr:hypothetical protein [Marinomonas balearica]TDO99939.1 hypothetical protein DFP79_0952 [Marinomonas balearica]